MKTITTTYITLDSEDGYSAVQEIIKYVSGLISDRNGKNDDIFPQYIYRGITRYDKSFENGTKDISEWTIRSGLAIRMSESYSEGFSKNDFVSALIDLTQRARKEFPIDYADYSDLEILADIQHNGGATCLVDFSKNLLTALWFACSNEKDDKKDGFLFCYNIIEDIKKHSLEYLNPTTENEQIKTVLLNTYRYTNYNYEKVEKFCLWEPTNINGRIVRQDSVFLFGTESFVIGEHDIFTVRIPRKLKRVIRECLSVLFNISSENMYKDSVGLATSNAKSILMPVSLCFKKNISDRKKRLRLYKYHLSEALAYINKGSYQSALSQLKSCEKYLGEVESMNGHHFFDGTENERKINVYFYLGSCYMKLNYLDNAIVEFEKVKSLSLKVLDKRNKKQKDIECYLKKCLEAYDLLIDISYDRQLYDRAFKYCNELVKMDFCSLNGHDTRISELSMLELCVLSNLMQKHEISDSIFSIADNLIKSENEDSYIYYLALYYQSVLSLLSKENNSQEYKNELKMLKERSNRILHSKAPLRGYIEWNFMDIQNAIEEMPKGTTIEQDKYQIMCEMLAIVISVRDLFQYLNDKARN